jgi:hypothetical protein
MSEVNLESTKAGKTTTREAYKFNPQQFDEEALKAWLGSRGAPKSEKTLAREQEYFQQLKKWSEMYSGKVPKEWGEVQRGTPWYYICGDIKNIKAPLTDDMIDAAIDYPLWHVPLALGEGRLLTKDQLAKLAIKDTMKSPRIFKNIGEAQKSMGAEPSMVDQAMQLNASVANATR